jgi:tetratricopeptide (TPR) repeat protein
MPDSLPLAPAAAYRSDLGGAATLGADDDAWLRIASIVHSAKAVSSGSGRRLLLASACAEAVTLLGREFTRDYSRIEWRGARHRLSPLLVLAHEMQQAGGLNLAAMLLDDLLVSAPELNPLWRGRLLALRARVAWKQGRPDEAEERYALIYGIGSRARVPELKARAEIGRTALAQLRGNLPAVLVHARRAVVLARQSGNRGVSRLAWHGVTIGLAIKGDFDRALPAGWTVLSLSGGFPILEAEALQNIGQIMLETGHPEEARSCFTAILSRRVPDHVSLASLGALALASAQLGIEATVEWAVREVWRARSLPVQQYELTNALLESAQALKTLGRMAEAARYRDAAQQIADQRQYHELVFNAERLAKEIAEARTFRREEARTIAARVRAFDDRLPRAVEFEAAGR